MPKTFISYDVSTVHHYQCDEWRTYFQQIVGSCYCFDACLKHDGTTTVFLSSFKGQQFVVKRYNTKNGWFFIRRFLQISRAKNCYQMAQRYLDADILTPEPIGYIQERFFFFKLRSWYICRHQSGVLLSDFLTDGANIPDKLNAARSHRHRKTWLKAITKDWIRLLRNWPHGSNVYQSLNHIKDNFFNQQQ